MDKLKRYSELIERVLQRHADFLPIGDWSEYENQILIDKERHHYQLMRVGWKGSERVHFCVFHIDLKEDKVWIQEDQTEEGIAIELITEGVPKEEIVLAFYAPYRRADTGFAAA